MSNKILILDYGSQFTQLIARRVREAHVYSEIHPGHKGQDLEFVRKFDPAGIIFSGGPNSVFDPDAPTADKAVLDLGIPILGICYGMQLIAHLSGAKVHPSNEREYGRADVTILDPTQRWTVDHATLASKSHNTPLLGLTLTGRAVHTLVGGRTVFAL